MIKSTNHALDTAPLVMVVGGYSPKRSIYNPNTRKYGGQIKGLINDVELIGLSPTDIKCLGKEYDALSKKQKKRFRILGGSSGWAFIMLVLLVLL